jgi:PAS domain S-box-containing protein
MKPPLANDYETIFLHAPVGMCISEDRIILSCNDALAAMFGYSRQALNGRSFCDLYPSADEFLRTGHRIIPIMNTKGRYSDERIMRRASGELFWCHVTGHALHANAPLGPGIWTFEDVS